MNLQQTQYSCKKIISYTDSIKGFLNYDGEERVGENDDSTLGGVLNDVNYTWLANGSRLVVLNSNNGVKLAAWNFGAVLRDSCTRITCVVGLQSTNGRRPLLVVGLQSGATRGMICIFDITSSKVIRAVQIDKTVTSINVVDDGCGPNLPGVLLPLDGILAVGTVEGKVLLLDLCRQALDEAVTSLNSEYVRDEITACEILPLTTAEIPELERHKEIAIRNSQHICIHVNDTNSTNYFTLKDPTGNVVIRANIVEVKVSALYFCPQLGSLLVGYNFGAIQIYNLLLVKLHFTHLHESITPVSHFAFQEPCDDPRAFCYLWVVYSNIEKVDNENVEDFPLAVMYAISCNTKEFLEGYGTLYQEIGSFSNRFQAHLKALPFSQMRNAASGHCVSLQAYSKGVIKHGNVTACDVVEDRIALCSVVWTVTNNAQTETFMGLFDLNQWYKEQMPSSVRFNDSPESYILFMSISELMNTSGSVLDVRIDSRTISQFTAAQRLEEHYFPSALAYKLVCTRADDLLWIDCPGIQRYILSRIEQAGSLCLLRPYDIFHNCIMMGLLPLFNDTIYNDSTTVNLQREMILSIALEHQLVSWLCRCAQDWSNGSQSSSGCTLEFLLNWAWQRANVLKTNSMALCQCLFDHSGMQMDSNTHVVFNHCVRQIKNLTSLYSNIVNNCARYLYDDFHEVRQQYNVLQMTSIYFEVLQWLLNVGLLPECPLYMYPRMNDMDRISAPYPVDSLVKFYRDRRETLFELQGERNVEPTQNCDLLFIDNLIDLQCGGNVLRDEWQQDGGSGLYPPPSLQACLRTYLVDNTDIVYKHSVFIYLFLDLAMTLDQNHYSPVITHLIKFPAVFKLSPSIIKITQAFWQLDHGDFSTAMSQLLDPLVNNEDLHPWHHRVAVKSLLAQGQHQHALLYHQVRKPPMLDLQDLCITITLLIVNDLLQEAFHFQRQHRSDCNESELLQHFMEACDKTNQLVNVLQFPLSDVEEQALMKYLEVNRRDDTENLLVIYYLHRSRFAEAMSVNERLNNNTRITQGLLGQRNMNFRNEIIGDYRERLPDISKKLLDFCSSKENATSVWKSIPRPQPMSVYVHDTSEKSRYKSSLIQTSLQRIKEAWRHPGSPDALPFLSTPRAVSRRKSISTPVIYSTSFKSDFDDDGPTPNKIRRITPRQPIGNLVENERTQRRITVSAAMLLLTPIIKRKVRSRIVSSTKVFEDINIGTPQSILKVRKLVKRSTSPVRPSEVDDFENDIQPIDKNAADIIKSSLVDLANYSISTPNKSGISPRKSIKTPKQGVRFIETRASSASSEGSVIDLEKDNIEVSKVSSVSDDVFYSPNVSDEASNSSRERKRKLNDSSIRARRSYKLDLSDSSTAMPTRDAESPMETSSESPAKRFPKVAARKSLTRKVLEQNTLTKALSTPTIQSQLSSGNVVGIEITHTEKSTSFVREVGEKTVEHLTEENKQTKNSYSTKTDPVTHEQTIKHERNESLNKSSAKLDSSELSDLSEIDPVLTSGSDVDESFLARYISDRKASKAVEDAIFSIDENLDSTFEDTQEDLIEEFPIVEEQTEKTIDAFEITDDLSDEDVEFKFQNTIEINTSQREANVVELQCLEPENYIEPDFEEEVGNVLSEDSNTNGHDLKENTDGNVVENIEICPEELEDEHIEERPPEKDEELYDEADDRRETSEESDRNEETSEEERSSDRNEDTSEEEKLSDRNEETSEEENESDESLKEIIEIGSSTEDDMDQLQIQEEEESEESLLVEEEEESENVLEKNILHFESESNSSPASVHSKQGSVSSLDSKASTIILVSNNEVESGIMETIVEEINEAASENNVETREAVCDAGVEIVTEPDKNTEQAINTELETTNEMEVITEREESFQKGDEIEAVAESDENIEKTTRIDIVAEAVEQTETNIEESKLETSEKQANTEITEPEIDEETESQNSFNLVIVESVESEPAVELKMTEEDKTQTVDEQPETTNVESSRKLDLTECDVEVNVECQPEKVDSTETMPEESGEKTIPLRRGRSSSVQKENFETNVDTPRKRKRANSTQLEEEEKPARRGRKSSAVHEEPEDVSSPRRITRSTAQESEKPKQTPPRITRRSSTHLEEEEKPITPARVTRRTSQQFDENTPTKQKPSTEEEKPARRARRLSVASDDAKSDTVLTPQRRARKNSEGAQSAAPVLETIEEYTSTHRLTRRQKELMEKTMKLQSMKKIDPIRLMEKETFDGPADPDEKLQHSPASSVKTESSVGTRSSARLRRLQEVQESPDIKAGSSQDDEETRSRRRSFTLAQQAISSPKSVKKRRTSNVSETSEISSASIPVVALERISPEDLHKLRHRSLSPSLLIKNDAKAKSAAKSKRRGKTSILQTVELSKIMEESDVNVPPRKRGRPRKEQSTSKTEDADESTHYTTFKKRISFKPKTSSIDK